MRNKTTAANTSWHNGGWPSILSDIIAPFSITFLDLAIKNHFETGTPKRRALKEDNKVTSNTILILLAGISMAATIGDNVPCTAKERPTIL
jgi:hypothetical protein